MIKSKLYRSYPVVKDAIDPRDLIATVPVPATNTSLEIVDLRSFCGPVKDQGQTSGCTAHAITEQREFLYRKYFDQEHDKTIAPQNFILSPRFIYYKEREFEGDSSQDGGASMRTSAKMLNNVGSTLLVNDPYTNIFAPPTPAQVAQALIYKSGAYHRINGGLTEMKSVLRSGYTFVFGIVVYESFEDDYTARTGIMLMPNVNREKNLGGHALHVCGFDDTKQVLIVQNSWGTGWGDKGYFYMPYAYASNPEFVSDIWINHLNGPWGTQAQINTVIEQSMSTENHPEPEPTPEVKPAEPSAPNNPEHHEG
jgi:C1A family cysteine protease